MAFQIQAVNRKESNLAAQIRQWTVPVAVLASWVVAAGFCLGSLNSMSATWTAARQQRLSAPAAYSASQTADA